MVPSVQIGLRYKLKDVLGEKENRNFVTHVAPIKFCIPCILDCQGMESSVGGTDDGVLSEVWNRGSDDNDEV